MGMTRHDHDDGCMIQMTHQGNEVVLVASMKYHTSWDWLMPVVGEIESRGYWFNRIIGDVTIVDDNGVIVISTPYSVGGHDMYYKAVVEFITFYNMENEDELTSDCCGASTCDMDMGICPDCLEHCEFTNEEE